VLGDVRGKGLMAGLELVADRETKAPLNPKAMAKIAEVAYESGVMIRVTGNIIILSPPLIISAADVEEIAAGLDAGLAAA
jgi:putrescine aminotransferase